MWNPLTGEYEEPGTPSNDHFGSHTDPPPQQQTDHFGSHGDFVMEQEHFVQYSQNTLDAMQQLEAESGVPQAVKTI